jgi:hypothetical protein
MPVPSGEQTEYSGAFQDPAQAAPSGEKFRMLVSLDW